MFSHKLLNALHDKGIDLCLVPIVRPDYSTPEIALRAKTLTFEERRSTPRPQSTWAPVIKTCPVIELYAHDTLDLNLDLGCQECLIYLSRCYCGFKKALSF